MRRRRLFVVASVFGVVGCAIGVACTFPTVEYAQIGGDEGGAPTEASTADAIPDALPDVSHDVHVLIDGGDPDALVVKDAGQKVDASGCTASVCDCDGDGFSDKTKPACQDAGGDCDDKDTRTHPGQGFLLDSDEAPRHGDWNCNDVVEKFYQPNVKCTALPAGPTCDATFGFADDPKCGANGSFVTCKTVGGVLGLLASCAVGSSALVMQACK